MSYQITLKRRASKALASLPNQYYTQVRDSIGQLASNPRPQGCLKLRGRDGWRIRVGVYRVIYQINDPERKITILDIGHRRDVYQ